MTLRDIRAWWRRLWAWVCDTLRRAGWHFWFTWDKLLLRVWYCPYCEGDCQSDYVPCPRCGGTGRRWRRR